MIVVADNDVVGAVAAMRRILESDDWSEYTEDLGLEFVGLKDVGLPADADDRAIWLTCQERGAVVVTADRADGEVSFHRVIGERNTPNSLPIFTIADPKRLPRDPQYARACAERLIGFLDGIESLRGVGRIYLSPQG